MLVAAADYGLSRSNSGLVTAIYAPATHTGPRPLNAMPYASKRNNYIGAEASEPLAPKGQLCRDLDPHHLTAPLPR